MLAACRGGASHPAPTSSADGITTRITLSMSSCGQGWTHPRPGPQRFVVTDPDSGGGELFLTDASSGAVYAYLDSVSHGSTANLYVNLGSGSYAFRCAMDEQEPTTGPTVTVPGDAPKPAPAVAGVTQADLIPISIKYQHYVSGRLPTLAAQVNALRTDIASGNLAKARADWLTAHLSYETLGAAYGAFGDLDGAINGLATGLPGGASNAGFTGFHRIEYELWHGGTTAAKRYADRLVTDLAALQKQFQRVELDPRQVAIRAHEITENALQFSLPGQDNYGSGTDLATISANLTGTRQVLDLLQPLLAPRYPASTHTRAELDATQRLVDSYHSAHGWTPPSALSTTQREHLDAAISELTELLAPVASICEPRNLS